MAEDTAEAWFNEGISHYKLGFFEQAVHSFEKALTLNPSFVQALSNCGIALHRLGQFDEALTKYDRAIAGNPEYAQAHYNRGALLQDLSRLDEAIASFDNALKANPRYAQAWLNRGHVLALTQRFEEAIESYTNALHIQPGWVDALIHRGRALGERQMFSEALHSYDEAVLVDPLNPESWCQRGLIKHRLRHLTQALADYDQALSLQPANAVAWSHRGIALQDLDRLDEAVASYDQAIVISPTLAEAWSNRGVALKELTRVKEAIGSFDKALELKPAYADAYWNKALACLVDGNFIDGLPLYEWRWKKDSFESPRRNLAAPLWLGDQPLEGKMILIHSEQGFGDTLQFCRYIQLVSERGGKVIFEVEKPLVDLMQNLGGVSSLVVKGDPLPPFDYHCPLLSLPLAFKTTHETIPVQLQYLTPRPEKIAYWRHRLGATGKPRVGLVWAGSSRHRNDRNRSLPAEFFESLFKQNIDVTSLQLNMPERDRAYLSTITNFVHFGEELVDFSDTAALCTCMDLVVTVDTSVAHLSAALGKATWTLLPYVPDWRWMLEGKDTPWYPTMKLFRQPSQGDWTSVQKAIQRDFSHIF